MVSCVGSPDGEIMHVYWKQNNNILRWALSDFGEPFYDFCSRYEGHFMIYII